MTDAKTRRAWKSAARSLCTCIIFNDDGSLEKHKKDCDYRILRDALAASEARAAMKTERIAATAVIPRTRRFVAVRSITLDPKAGRGRSWRLCTECGSMLKIGRRRRCPSCGALDSLERLQ
jgi:rRNA maturation endonuclease Nob1